MTLSSTSSIDIVKRRHMLYKAIQEFPDNQRIRNSLIRTYAKVYLYEAAQAGVYICYSRPDELFALELATALRQADVNVWFDQIDVEPDEDWEYAVSKAVKRSGMMLYVMSPNASSDEVLQQEVSAFMESGKLLIPLLHAPCEFNRQDMIIPPIDFSENFESGLATLLDSITNTTPVNA